MINIFIGAIILSIWFTTLFFGKSIGLSMLLFVVPLTYFIIHILENNNKIENKKAKIFIIPITLLSATYFIYNNQFFNIMNILVIPILVLFMILGLFNEKLEISFINFERIFEVIFMPIGFISEAFESLKDEIQEKLKLSTRTEKEKQTAKVVKAIIITIPIVLVIIALLSSADQVFGNIFIKIYYDILNMFKNIKISKIVWRIIVTAGVFCYLFCLFDYIRSRYKKDDIVEEKKKINKDNFTVRMILTVLNMIYLVFCIIQIKSLFMKNVSINYAEYARQGFFQLMIVSIINLVMILISKRFENSEEIKQNKYINVMCIVMILFTFIILISSAYRMYLYESAFGYTLLRLLVYCSLFTESVLLIPTIMYVLDKKVELVKTYFIIIISMYICMNFANFDNIIAKRNVDRYMETGKIDLEYLENETGTDAVEQLSRILEKDSDYNDEIKTVKNYFNELKIQLNDKKMDFRDLNLSKIFAIKIIEK